MEDVIIIGCGPIGLYGATLCALHNLKGIVLESREEIGGQLTALYPEKAIVDLPGFDSIKAKDFIQNLYAQYTSKDNRLPIHLHEKVVGFRKEEDAYLIETNKGSYLTKTVLITTGMGSFSPRKIGLPNEDEFENILYSCKDVSRFAGCDIAVLGGGDSAIDLSLLIAPVAKSVAIVHRRPEFRGQSYNVERMEKEGVSIYKNYAVSELKHEGSRIGLILKENANGSRIALNCDYILVQYGQVPSSDSFDLEKENNLIKTGASCQTSKENIFASGNIAVYEGKVKNLTTGFGEVNAAVCQIDRVVHPDKNIAPHF